MSTSSDDHILIIGTGFAGLGMAIRLKQAGIDDFTILERADDVGGTWRDNTYPGAACDVPSHLYSFSFEKNAEWSRFFAPQEEIFAYLRRCVDKYDLRRHIRFGATVSEAAFDTARGQWELSLAGGEKLRGRVVIAGCGPLNRAAWPDIPGLDTFAGAKFHSSAWDHGVPLEGKTVAVIGTGASAIQIVPAIAGDVGKLHLFQRTAPWVLPKPDGPIGPSLRRRFAEVPALQTAARTAIYWIAEALGAGFVIDPRLMRLREHQATRFLEREVSDPGLRAKLTPHFRMGCKRILYSNDYYRALTRENVEVVTDRIREIRPHSIVTSDGVERPIDALVLATGFNAADAVAPFPVRGRFGQDLNEAWRDGAEAYLGSTVAGFPNLFFLIGPNTGLGHNSMVFMIESQIAYVLDALKTMRSRSLAYVDVKPAAQHRYNTRLHQRLAGTVWSTGCSSWYQSKTGKNTTLWPGFTWEFRLRTRAFDPARYELGPKRARKAASEPERAPPLEASA